MPLLAKSSCGIRIGGVAQWLVQRLHKALVGGSNPPSATIYFYGGTSVAVTRQIVALQFWVQPPGVSPMEN